jgi:hypothetical protein
MNYENPKLIERTQKSYLRILASSFLIGCSLGVILTLQQYKPSPSPTHQTTATTITTGGSNYKHL